MALSTQQVGRNISILRAKQGLTQQQLAGILNVTHQAVSKWENGAAMPDIESLLQLSRLFGVTLEQLLQEEMQGEATPSQEATDSLVDENVVEGLKDAASQVAQTARDIGTSIFSRVSRVFSPAKPAQEENAEEAAAPSDVAEEEKASNENAQTNPYGSTMSIEALVDLAPFMSRDKLSTLVDAYTKPISAKTLLQLAPYLSSEVLGKKLQLLDESEFTNDLMVSFAPFMKKEQLFKLILANPEKLDAYTLKRLAPFLKKNMVDALVDVISGVKAAVTSDAVKDFTDKAVKGAGCLWDKLKDAASGIAQSVQEAVREPSEKDSEETENTEAETEDKTPQDEEASEEAPAAEAPGSDLDGEACKAESAKESCDLSVEEAFAARSWAWLRQNLYKVNGQVLLKDIALAAAHELDDAEASDMLLNAAPYLAGDHLREVALELAQGELWGRVCDLAPFMDAGTDDELLSLAARADDKALDAVKLYAPLASRACVKALMREAIDKGNLAVAGILSDAI